MKCIPFTLLLIFLGISCNQPFSGERNPDEDNRIRHDFSSTLNIQGINRKFEVELPQDYDPDNTYPIVFIFHGESEKVIDFWKDQIGFRVLGDQKQFIQVYPFAYNQGSKILSQKAWNAGECCHPATTEVIDDLAFVDQLMVYLNEKISYDRQRTYAVGFGNGAHFVYRLANRFSNRFAAVAAVAGVLQDFPFKPSRSVPLIHFHSYQDELVPYQGGSTIINDEPNYFPPIDSTMNLIADAYGCDLRETLVSDPSRFDQFRYVCASSNAEIEVYVTYDGGHGWPGATETASGVTSEQLVATELIWAFFEKYTL